VGCKQKFDREPDKYLAGLEPDESAPMIEPACCAAATATSA